MSRVAITDLQTGEVATSAAVNATLSSWVAALASGAVGADNVRQEGIDRRTLSAAARAVYSAGGGVDSFFSDSGTSGAVGPTAAFTWITLGGNNMQVGPIAAASAGDRILITGAVQLVAANNTLVEVTIERTTNPAGVWAVPAESPILRYQTKVTATNPPLCVGFPMIQTLQSTTTAYYYRLAYRTTGAGTVTFSAGTLLVEDFAK